MGVTAMSVEDGVRVQEVSKDGVGGEGHGQSVTVRGSPLTGE